MFVMLLGSIANAQTFDFECEAATFESELAAIYAADTPPTELGDLINNASDTAEASTDSGDFFKSLGADSGYTVASFSGDEIGFYFRIDAIDTPKIYSEVEHINTPASHRAFTLQIVKHIWDLLHPDYVSPEELAALRTERINELDALDITGVSVAHTTQSNGNDSFSVTNPGNQFVINADWYGPGLVENHTDEEFADLRDAVIAAREELNPANDIYGFTPSQFQIASVGERLTKAFDIAKANRDFAAVDGNLNKEIGNDKVTLRIGAKNYPFEVKPELLNTANYEGWKTFIDRILYLVKTGDGSERTTRENHINGIAGNISVKDLDGGDDDWAVAWNDLPFIYGGSDENDHNNSYDDQGNTSRVFAGYHQDNIGLLPGIVYEALLVEVHRINGYVIAADALRRHTDGGYNKEREMGLKALLTGNATFDENMYAEWIILNSDVTVWTNSKYGPICDVPGYLWLGVMDNYSFRYMYIIVRNELLRNDDSIRYYNNVNQNIYCN